jgi:hypothetical protein
VVVVVVGVPLSLAVAQLFAEVFALPLVASRRERL